MDFTDQTEDFIRRSHMLRQKESVTVGISGGADSVCLFLQLNRLKDRLGIRLSAVTVEHGIRGEESRRDAEFSKELCEKYGVSCTLVHVDAPGYARAHGLSLEEAARQLRYRAFFENTADGDSIALAHHLEDQAETVLFHMIRGSGVRGLTGMRPVSESEGRRIIRPLLFATKPEIVDEVRRCGEKFCTDVTNEDTSYARNRLRQIVIPELVSINSGAVRHICESAESVSELYERFLEDEAEVWGKAFIPGDTKEHNRIRLCLLERLPDETISQLLMEYLRRTLRSIKDVGRRHLDRLVTLVKENPHFSYNLPKGAQIRAEYGVMSVVYNDSESLPETVETDLSDITGSRTIEIAGYRMEMVLESVEKGQENIFPPKTYEKSFDYDKIRQGLCLRRRRAGDFLVIDREGHRKSLDTYLKNEKVRSEERDAIPLLVSGENHVAWAVGYRISEDVKVTADTSTVLTIKVYGSTEDHNGRQDQSHAL